MPKLSLLDLVFVNEGQELRHSFEASVELAQAVETFGFHRIWVAEHHNMSAIASAATSLVVGLLASRTKKIRVGAGGIMLPNHSPLVIAEQFGTLESLYPGRIDLGLGRAPGTDQRTLRALRRDPRTSEHFPDDVLELQHFLSKESAQDSIVATPGQGTEVPLWILGSSLFGAKLAAHLGLPYAFASHFAPDAIASAVRVYREEFRPSKQLKEPYVMLGVNIITADSDEHAKYLATSQKQSFANLHRKTKMKFPKPIRDMDAYWSEPEKRMAEHMLRFSFVGSAQTVESGLKNFVDTYKPDELMVVTSVYDLNEKIHSLELTSGLFS